jgi:hypothetical protein
MVALRGDRDAGFQISVAHVHITSMATKRLPRPRDPAQLAKLIVDIATGQVEDRVSDDKSVAAVARGKAGGAKGGQARAKVLSATRRKEIAVKAAKTRWKTSAHNS